MKVSDLTPDEKRNFKKAWIEYSRQRSDDYNNKKEIGGMFTEFVQCAAERENLDFICDFLQSQTGIKILCSLKPADQEH